jgi:hypothetical protein
MKKFIAFLAFAFSMLSVGAIGQSKPPPTIGTATDGIFTAFRLHPLVALAEAHGLAQEMDFYSTLIRDPRFAREVGNVVMEIGDAAQQKIVDRYVNGENVPYSQLRKVWADTVGWSADAGIPIGSINVYATIRDVNMTLPPKSRIKVWLGDPPVNWSQIKTKADLAPLKAQRDSYPVQLIEREILGKNKKALVIYGADHLRLGIFADRNNLRARIDKSHPSALFIVFPYVGYATAQCAAQFERHIRGWPIPALVYPVRGSSLEEDAFRPGCGIMPLPNLTREQYEQLMRDYLVQMSDALLYLGPRNRLTQSPVNPDIYLDLSYRSELERRYAITDGGKFSGSDEVGNNASAKPFFPN